MTGFIRLNGVTVGAVANGEQEMSARGAQKAADFVNFCDAFNIPVLTVTNVKGYKASLCSERNLAKAAARLTYAFANATVPKVNVIAGEAFGSAYVTMNSKGLGADLVFAWKDAKIGMMDAGMAAKVMYADADAQTQSEKAKEYAALQDERGGCRKTWPMWTQSSTPLTRESRSSARLRCCLQEGRPPGQKARNCLGGVNHYEKKLEETSGASGAS